MRYTLRYQTGGKFAWLKMYSNFNTQTLTYHSHFLNQTILCILAYVCQEAKMCEIAAEVTFTPDFLKPNQVHFCSSEILLQCNNVKLNKMLVEVKAECVVTHYMPHRKHGCVTGWCLQGGDVCECDRRNLKHSQHLYHSTKTSVKWCTGCCSANTWVCDTGYMLICI